MLGYNEMRRRIRPKKIICYGKPFEDMKGDIIEIDYVMPKQTISNTMNLYT